MRHFGSRKRIRISRPRIQHSPASVLNTVATGTGLLVFAITPDSVAGTAASATREGSDRATEVTPGSFVPRVDYDISVSAIAAGSQGPVEVCFFKVERSFIVPVIGTDPIPSNANLATGSLQQLMRMNMPGWVQAFYQFAVTPETVVTRHYKINLAKFRKSKQRDGDFTGMLLVNKTGGSIDINVHMRYYQYK